MRPLAFLTLTFSLLAGLTFSAHADGHSRYSNAGHAYVDTNSSAYRYGYDRTLGHGTQHYGQRSAHRRVGVRIGHRAHRVQRHHVQPRVRHHRPRRVHRTIRRDPYANRTKFCRTERAIDAHTHRKVRVKRCIYVRNDLLGNYVGGGWSRH